MPNITADADLYHSMYAKTDIDLYNQALNKIGTLPAGAYIGEVYSYLLDIKTGDIYWLFYRTPQDYTNFNATYVKHDPNQLDLPSYQDLMDAVTSKIEADKLQSMGTVNYFIQKYAPYLIAAGAAALILPSILKKNQSKNISGMKQDDLIKLAVVGAIIYFIATYKKRTGTVIVDPLDQGSYGDSAAITNNTGAPVIQQGTMVSDVSQPQQNSIASGKSIDYVGPFLVTYQAAAMGGKKRKFVI